MMQIDMERFHQVFFEEAAEHLANMESLLLALDLTAPDDEQLNAIFRAAHSIKGSSGTFGFADMQEVTHTLEELLDKLRRGTLPLSNEIIDACLATGDLLKNLLSAHQGEGGIADQGAIAAICARLQQLSGVSPPADTPMSVVESVPSASTFQAGAYELRFVLAGEVEAHAATIENLIAELATLCEVELVERAPTAGVHWHLRVHGVSDVTSLRTVLEFVADSDSIQIDALENAALPQAQGSDEDGFGFFVDLPTPNADEGFGFFDPLPSLSTQDPVPASPEEISSVPLVPESITARRAVSAPKPVAETSIRVGVDKVDQLINLIGELVITQAMLLQAAAPADPAEFQRLHDGLAQLERNTRDLQDAVLSIRMLPISVVFSRFPRVVRDLAQKLGKQVELKMFGEATELDKGLVEKLADPLTHLVRNSLDHGIEAAEVRTAQGKPPTGTITLSAYHQSGNIVIEVSDDGAGLNRERIFAKAQERGLTVHKDMSDQEIFALIFEAGFSTAEQVTEVSGRGVGMDVVKRNIAAFGGRIQIDSQAGSGTRMTVRLPLTLAILDGMSVAVGSETYILPLGYVVESLIAERADIKRVAGTERLLRVREDYLPVIVLHEVFGVPDAQPRFTDGIMIVLECDGVQTAMFVDAMLGQHQVVIKSIETNYRKVPGIAGATIMGDGRVALILDVPTLAERARRALPAAA